MNLFKYIQNVVSNVAAKVSSTISNTIGNIFKYDIDEEEFPEIPIAVPVVALPQDVIEDEIQEDAKEYFKARVIARISITYSKTKNSIRDVDINSHRANTNDIFTFPRDKEEFKQIIINAVENYIAFIGDLEDITYKILDVNTVSYRKSDKSKIKDMKMMIPTNFLDISHFIDGEIVPIKIKTNCVRDSLLEIYKGLWKDEIEKLGDDLGVTLEELEAFCAKKKIHMIAFDIDCEIVEEYIPPKKSGKKRFMYIINNNHIYVVNSRNIKKKVTEIPQYNEVKVVQSATNVLKKFLREGLYPNPKHMKIRSYFDNGKKIDVSSFVYNGVYYTDNSDYDQCINLEKLLKLEGLVTPTTSRYNVLEILEKAFTKTIDLEEGTYQKSKSFFPTNATYSATPCVYSIKRIDTSRPYINIDHKKHFANELLNMEYLPVLNFMQGELITEFPENYKCTKDYLYLAQPKNGPNMLLPSKKLYDGQFLEIVQNMGILIEVLEAYPVKNIPNHISEMYSKIFKLIETDQINEQFIKESLVIYQGKMNKNFHKKSLDNATYIGTKDQVDVLGGFIQKITNDYYLAFETEEVTDVYTRKPISIRMIDMSRLTVYKKILEIGIPPEDIIQIYNDSICFYTDNLKNWDPTIHISTSKISGWRDETEDFILHNEKNKYHPTQDIHNDVIKCPNSHVTFKIKQPLFPQYTELNMSPAGSGKSYFIKHKLVPKLKDYIILCPQQQCLTEYREMKLPCQVYEYYTINKTFPKEKTIIIDEIGLYNHAGNIFLFQCALLGKIIYAFGDYKQLLPPFETHTFDQKYFLKSIFHKIIKNTDNHRNEFSQEYYQNLFDSQEQDYLYSEVKKYSTKHYYEADVIICYRNTVVDHYNDLMLKHLGFEDKFQKGVKLICTDNKFAKKGIYNKWELTITETDGNIFELSENGNKYSFKKSEIEKYFKPAYARTAYGIQGQSRYSYYFPAKDKFFIDGRSAYTIISRLKKDKTEEPKAKKVYKYVEPDDINDQEFILDFE